MNFVKVHIQSGQCWRDPVPSFLPYDRNALADLSWIDPGYGLVGMAWWPEDNQIDPLGLYEHYDVETLTVDRVRRVVVSTATKKPWTAEEIAAYKAPYHAYIWNAIKAERDGVTIQGGRSDGGVLVSGHWFHSDVISRIKWLALKDTVHDMKLAGAQPTDAIMVDGEAIMWKTMAGAFVPVDLAMVGDVVEAIKVLDKRLFKAAEVHRMQLLAAHDPANYDYSTGWPQRYVDTLAAPIAQVEEPLA